ncbi:MAG: kinesin family [Lasallia pustulata]|uniref:Kinesin-like protein n=1 Tax=Lasallia pustulata TaxID=136370 RepID=A0A5M8Q3J0_9LECA|nr:MAG: kinesin family [Lasallia pustulata]
MDPPPKPSSTSLFQVYLRLRPRPSSLVQLTQQSLYPLLTPPERYLTVEPPVQDGKDAMPTHITLQAPSDSRKRAVEKFAFTKVFEEQAEQLDIFKGTGLVPLIEGVIGEGRDGLLATLGVTGSGKSHTILGSKSQRGLTQLSLDALYRSIKNQLLHTTSHPSLVSSLSAADASEAQILPASSFLDGVYGDVLAERSNSRTPTPMMDSTSTPSIPRRNLPHRPSALPQYPDISDVNITTDPNIEYAILISMYEVYNDRIFDLLSNPPTPKDLRRRHLLFKSTEASPDRKVVAGLRKVVCASYEEALMVLETGLVERRVAGTGSNSASSRSHGFFCIEVKRRPRGGAPSAWSGAQVSIVDLAGSERARNAKTAGATLAEAGKINESLMYLGQCLQMQSDCHDGAKPSIVPFRQCKLTELLFSNSFPSSAHNAAPHHAHHHRNAQKAIMIVTADPLGDFNATSQILRYSALAREVTVPRIPSVTSTILSGTTAVPRSQVTSGRVTPNAVSAEEYEAAVSEVARLDEEVEILGVRLAEEEGRRREAEEEWRRAEERTEEVERQVREECWAEMEVKIEAERRRWMGAWCEEADRNDEHLDRKLEILSRGIQIHEDPGPHPDDHIADLESQNEALRRKLDAMERELQCRSPTKSKPRNPSGIAMDSSDAENVGFRLVGLSLESRAPGVAKTPRVKGRKLTARKWDFGEDEEGF